MQLRKFLYRADSGTGPYSDRLDGSGSGVFHSTGAGTDNLYGMRRGLKFASGSGSVRISLSITLINTDSFGGKRFAFSIGVTTDNSNAYSYAYGNSAFT